MWYMSSTTAVLDRHRINFGLFETLTSRRSEAVTRWSLWALDNGRYPKKSQIAQAGDISGGLVHSDWTHERWVASLNCYPKWTRRMCKFAVVPDVPFNAQKTLAMFDDYRHFVTEHGYPIALVTQNGMTVKSVPFDKLDAIFVGGDDSYKFGCDTWDIIDKAHELNKWVHFGRINSIKNMKRAYKADSADGTTLSIEPSIRNLDKMASATAWARAKKQTERLL